MLHWASAEDGATPSVVEGCTTPTSLRTSSCDQTVSDILLLDQMQLTNMSSQILAEARDASELTAGGTEANPTTDHVVPLSPDDAAGEDNSQRTDNIATVAGSSQTVQG